VARRRYKSDAISHAGRREQPRDQQTVGEEYPRGSEVAAPEARPREECGKPEPDQSAQHFSTGLKDQIDAQRAYANDPLNAYLDAAFPSATPNERAWLKANPRYLQNPTLTHHAAMIALQRGIPRHSGEFLSFIGQLLDQHAAATQAPPMHAPMPPPSPPMPPQRHIDLTESHKGEPEDGEPESDHDMTHHYAAPVSRGESSHSIEPPELSPSQVRLSAEEREAAHAAGISDEEYGKQKLRMMKLKKAKVIKD
jgi:hypothetical protein